MRESLAGGIPSVTFVTSNRLAVCNRLHSVVRLECGLPVDAPDFFEPRVDRFVDRSVTTAGPGWDQKNRALGLD